MLDNPLISVILPVYNAEKYIAAAIKSILQQTFTDFELLILNDGSTDKSEEIILNFQDLRITYFKSKANKGLIHQLNKGIERAQGKYIARMDADDISLPTRFEKQIRFLEANPDFVLVGSHAKIIDKKGNLTGREIQVPECDEAIKIGLLFQCPFIHPSVVGEAEIFKKFNYSNNFPVAEDFHLWGRILGQYSAANINEPLIHYRAYEQNTSKQNNNLNLKLKSLEKIFTQQFAQLGIQLSSFEISLHLQLYILSISSSKGATKKYQKVYGWVEQLRKFNQTTFLMNEQIFEKNLRESWYSFCIRNASLGRLSAYLFYIKSNLGKSNGYKANLLLLLHTLGSYPLIEPIYLKIRKRILLSFGLDI